METRKIQLTGGSSYDLTLPKKWINSMNLGKNDSVGVEMQPDGALLITTDTVKEQKQKSKSFDTDDLTDQKYIFRLLLGAYLTGHSPIVVNAKKQINLETREAVRMFTQTAIGPEIIEESSTSIIIKDLLNPTEMPSSECSSL